MPLYPIKWQTLKFFAKIHKSPLLIFNVVKGAVVSDLRQFLAIGSPLKNYEKYFLLHPNKLNMLLANQILHILYIFISPDVWYSWSFAIKIWFPFNFPKSLQGRHFAVGRPKNFKLLADISFESSLQNIVLSSLLLFLCACY